MLWLNHIGLINSENFIITKILLSFFKITTNVSEYYIKRNIKRNSLTRVLMALHIVVLKS